MAIEISKSDRKRIQDYAKTCAELGVHAALHPRKDAGVYYVYGHHEKILALVSAPDYQAAFDAVARIRDKATKAAEARKFAERARSTKWY